MTLGLNLKAIALAARHRFQQQLIEEFKLRIEGHPEEKILLDCLKEAELGRSFLDFGRDSIVPEALNNEGFCMEMVGPGFHLNFGD